MRKLRPYILSLIYFLVFIALFDTSYLTYKHFFEPYAQCSLGLFGDCGAVLKSQYSVLFGIPLAMLGLVHYIYLGLLVQAVRTMGDMFYKRLLFIQSAIGFVLSIYFAYLQFFIIKSLCQYCLLSALISFALYFFIRAQYEQDYRIFILEKIGFIYKLIGKPLFFLLPAEWVHEQAMWWGKKMGSFSRIYLFFSKIFSYQYPSLQQKRANISFQNPIGLSAGYDYEASFPHILPSFGFGFETIGTISNLPFEGNKKPRLGRLA